MPTCIMSQDGIPSVCNVTFITLFICTYIKFARNMSVQHVTLLFVINSFSKFPYIICLKNVFSSTELFVVLNVEDITLWPLATIVTTDGRCQKH